MTLPDHKMCKSPDEQDRLMNHTPWICLFKITICMLFGCLLLMANTSGQTMAAVAWTDPNMPIIASDPADMVFVKIPSGTFEMGDHSGDGSSDEQPVHTVTLDGFEISPYETTNSQYAAYLNTALAEGLIRIELDCLYAISDSNGSEPYGVVHCPDRGYNSQIEYTQGQFTVLSRDDLSLADHPVVEVTWYGAQAFCRYYGYRLPTEAEWENAARGGYHSPYRRYPWDSNEIDCSQANFQLGGGAIGSTYCNPLNLTHKPYTSPVGYYGLQGNYGLCDMAGNVCEWCQDWRSRDYYPFSPGDNPTGPEEGISRIIRSGSWEDGDSACCVSNRAGTSPQTHYRTTGFRVCRNVSNDPCDMVFVTIEDPGVTGHEGFSGQMSKYEVTHGQYCHYLNTALADGLIQVVQERVYAAGDMDYSEPYFDTIAHSPYSQIYYDPNGFHVRQRDGYGMKNHPVVMVSWHGATSFAEYYGYRLPTEWEWQAVADYDGSFTYGCGTTIDPNRANYHSANPLGLSDKPYTSPVGHYPACGYGLCDLAGNVWEWTSSCSDNIAYLRGGAWYGYATGSHCQVTERGGGNLSKTERDIGFRVYCD